jgi:hypothetical protein
MGDDSRLDDDRDPTAHKVTHEIGGSDLVDHDNLTNFVADEHIDHTDVAITLGDDLEFVSGTGVIDESMEIGLKDSISVTTVSEAEAGVGVTADGVLLKDGTVQGAKSYMTAEGGLAVKLTNKTGGASVKGEVVTVYNDSAIDHAVEKIVVDIPNPIGVFYESGVADGAEAWVVVSGIADVYFVSDATRGHIARGFLTADGASYVTGQALSEAVPGSPFAADKHFYEIGHVLESRTGAGLAKCVLHFN